MHRNNEEAILLRLRWAKEVIRAPSRDDVNVRKDLANAGDGSRGRRNREVRTAERLLVLFDFTNVVGVIAFAEKDVHLRIKRHAVLFTLSQRPRRLSTPRRRRRSSPANSVGCDGGGLC
jgi:hypothetical protein